MSRPPTLEYQSNQSQSPPKPGCRNCNRPMLQGVAVEAFPPTGTIRGTKQVWLEGEIRRGWLGALKLPKGRPYEIVAFRCTGCGLVEFYSPIG